MTTHPNLDQDAWDNNDQDQHQDRRRHGRRPGLHKRTRPSHRHHRPRPRAVDGECGLRLLGVDGHCSGPERVSLGNGRAGNQRGCVEHAAQTLVRRPGWRIVGGHHQARTALEARMRAAGSWRPEMARPGTGGRD